MMVRDTFDKEWWGEKWREREQALWQAFGPSHPSGSGEGYVTAFDFREVPLPGACAYTFRPNEGDAAVGRDRRESWMYVSHGLSQWQTRGEVKAARKAGNRATGAGYELGMIAERESPWVPGLLRSLMSYAHKVAPLNAGDRMPVAFHSIEPASIRWCTGQPEPGDPPPVDQTRSLVFWRYLSPFGSFTVSTGCFEIRIATAITGSEWELAQATTSCHLLLLLHWAGVGQRTVPGRASVTSRPGWEAAWAEIKDLSFDAARERLRAIWRQGANDDP
jgi:hypothetical protein